MAEQQGLIIDNSGSFDVTVEAVPHTLLPSNPLAATRFYVGDASFTYGADAGAIAIGGDCDGDGISELGFTTPDNLWHLDLNGDRVDSAGEALDTQ